MLFKKGQIPWNKGMKGQGSETWTPERKIALSKVMSGSGNRFYGKKHNEETKKIIKEKRALQDMSWRIGILKPREIKQKISQTKREQKLTGEKCHLWKGGTTPLKMLIRSSSKSIEWRKSVFEKDNFTCQLCEKRGGDLEVDHFPKTFADIFYLNKITSIQESFDCKEFWDIENGRTLCKPCHKVVTYGFIKSNFNIQKQYV